MLPFEGQFPSSRCGNCILCSTRFRWQLLFNRAFAGEIYQQRFIFTAQQFAEWLFTHYGILRRCVISYFLNCGWDDSHYLLSGKPFPLPTKIKKYGIIVCSETSKGPWGSRPQEAIGLLDLQIGITLCVFWVTLIPAREKRPLGGHLGTYSTNWG